MLILKTFFLPCTPQDLEQNKICDVLKERSHATVMTEMLLVAFNRGGKRSLSCTSLNSLFGGQGNSKRQCWYMHFKSSLVPHPLLKLVDKISR